MEIYLGLIILMSIITFILYAIDKKRAIKNKWRIKEATLLLSSFLLGSIGGLIGMYGLRHKTQHWYFVVVNFLSLIIHIVLGVVIYNKIGYHLPTI